MMEQVKETLVACLRDDSLSINQKIGMVKFTILVTFTTTDSGNEHTESYISHMFRKVLFFSIMALHDVIKGGIPCMGTSPGGACTHQCASFGSIAQD